MVRPRLSASQIVEAVLNREDQERFSRYLSWRELVRRQTTSHECEAIFHGRTGSSCSCIGFSRWISLVLRGSFSVAHVCNRLAGWGAVPSCTFRTLSRSTSHLLFADSLRSQAMGVAKSFRGAAKDSSAPCFSALFAGVGGKALNHECRPCRLEQDLFRGRVNPPQLRKQDARLTFLRRLRFQIKRALQLDVTRRRSHKYIELARLR
jgi:hypothetical protein